MYQIPLRFIKASKNVAICATRITAMLTMSTRQGRLIYHREKDGGTLINATGRAKARTLIFLDNGTVVASAYEINTIVRNLRLQEIREELYSAFKDTTKVKAFDVKTTDTEIDRLMSRFEEEERENQEQMDLEEQDAGDLEEFDEDTDFDANESDDSDLSQDEENKPAGKAGGITGGKKWN